MDEDATAAGAVYGLADHVRGVTNADYGMLLDLRTGKFHSLNRLGADLIRAVREAEDLGAWERATAERYGVAPDRVARDVATFVERLVGLGMLQRRTAGR